MKFSDILRDWYSVNKRVLPWRETKNPYHIWLSEIILQQTQVKQGLPYYNAFIANYPTIHDLAKASEEQVLKLWQGLGYYSRARNLHHAANTIVEDLDGSFPKTYNDLIQLKGIGDYTASAIASICYDSPTAVVDGNVYRLLSRYFGIETPINTSKGISEFKALAQSLLPKTNIGDHNQAIMEFGSRQCKPKSPDCFICPLNTSCAALLNNKINRLPIKLNKIKTRKRHFNFLVILSNNNKTILEQRKEKGIWQNLFQFPLVETSGELNSNTFSSQKDVLKFFKGKPYQFSLYNEKEIVHRLSHQVLYTKFWIVQIDELPYEGIDISKIQDFPVPVLISKFISSFNFNK